ncbi:hypothetical protein SAMN04487820_110149 [Actinopolyspora mzabensis]|uniref:ABC transporter n=1 Tax=Actinopolyspora mzabensis TaxID=995066 RepID=A0A1G9DKD4_ACTMZ|nr:hypothetical protein [Actinopolyspora mzabensis]SDK64304.1 hypothetical protein SAMN04487820_110149 [Actinopolyspora mzabensis]
MLSTCSAEISTFCGDARLRACCGGAEERTDDIAEFTELGDFLHMPLRTYSAGMRVRLALGVITTIAPEILILDEGLGAVDAAFMAKARRRLVDLVNRSGMLVFASHSDELLLELCTTAIWMDEGRIRMHGSVHEILTTYKGDEPYVVPKRSGQLLDSLTHHRHDIRWCLPSSKGFAELATQATQPSSISREIAGRVPRGLARGTFSGHR